MIITDKNFENLIANNNVVIKFGAPWCGPCRQLDPIIHKLEAETDKNYIVGSVDVDVNSVVSTTYGVRNIPTILFFKEGKLVDKMVGYASEASIREKITTSLN